MISNKQWEEIALQYRKEIEELHKEIDSAIEELEKKMPRSFEKCIKILDNSLCSSQESLYLTKLMEYSILSKDRNVSNIKNKSVAIDCFEGLL